MGELAVDRGGESGDERSHIGMWWGLAHKGLVVELGVIAACICACVVSCAPDHTELGTGKCGEDFTEVSECYGC